MARGKDVPPLHLTELCRNGRTMPMTEASLALPWRPGRKAIQPRRTRIAGLVVNLVEEFQQNRIDRGRGRPAQLFTHNRIIRLNWSSDVIIADAQIRIGKAHQPKFNGTRESQTEILDR